MVQTDFISRIAPLIIKECYLLGYKYPSAIIAQACHESAYGQSKLSRYNNFFGMKCGSSWNGASVNLDTKEQLKTGEYIKLAADFRAYEDIEKGVTGYFDFINKTRYITLKTAVSSYDYLVKIREDGYATDLNYVTKVYNIVDNYNLQDFDLILAIIKLYRKE